MKNHRSLFCPLAGPLALIVLVIFGAIASARAQPLEVSTLAGSAAAGAVDGVGAEARFEQPTGVAVDAGGNVFVADSGNSTIRKISPTGVVTTLAGTAGRRDITDGVGSAARFSRLAGLTIDAAGVLYASDNHAIRRISPTGEVTTLAGQVQGVPGLQDGTGSAAQFNLPQGLAVDAAGNIYTAEPANNAVRRITPAGVVTTYYRDVSPVDRRHEPRSLAFDGAGNLYFVDARFAAVYRVSPAGELTEHVPNLIPPTGDGGEENFLRPSGLVADAAGNLFVADAEDRTIRYITANRVVRTVAGLSTSRGSEDGTGVRARFLELWALARDAAGTLYIADRGNMIRRARPGDAAAEALAPAGTLWAMGSSAYGQLGVGEGGERMAPAQIADDVIAASAGLTHSVFIKRDGTLWAMGANSYGQLGDGTTTERRTPVRVASGVIAAATGGGHTLFIKADRSLWAMGANESGELGDGTFTNRALPVQVATEVVAIAPAASSSHSLFLKADGGLWGMGRNLHNQLGGGSTSAKSTPLWLASDVVAMAAGGQFTVFIKRDGTLWGMGNNEVGQLGDGTLISRAAPVQIASQVRSVAAGLGHTVFLKTDGTLWTVGYDQSGQLGDGQSAANRRTTPAQIASGVVEVAAGTAGTLYLKADGTLWGTGGFGIAQNTQAPVRVVTGVARLSLGGSHGLLIAGTFASPPVAAEPGRVINFSVLTPLSAPGDAFTLGYVVSGASAATPLPVIVRAAGPSLAALGYPGTLADPRLELYSGTVKTAENDNWGSDPATTPATAAAMAAVGAFAYTDLGSLDAAVAASIVSRDNSARVSASTREPRGTGAVIAEVYDATPAASVTATTPRLINVSVLKNVGPSVTLGFVIGGGGARTMLVRAIGPTLGVAPFNVPGTMADPRIELFDGAGRSLGANDNWNGAAALATAFGQTGAFALPVTSRDAALLTILPPGNYTAVVTPAPGTATGTALLEVYEVP